MKHFLLSLLTMLFAAMHLEAGSLTLEQILRGEYGASSIHGVRPLADGERYAQLEGNRIVAHSFRTGEEVGVLFDATNTIGDVRVEHVSGYILSPDEQTILIQTDRKPIYRHSATAVYYIYNVRNHTLVPLSDGGPQEVPAFSKDGTMIAFVREGNLFLVKLLYNNSESQVTKDGEFNKVINGKPDWVNEEEFSFDRAFDFNADGTMIAWIRYDESAVPQYSFPLYRGLEPQRQEFATYPGAYTYKYPMAGETNSTVTVHSYDIKSHVIRQMKLPLDKDGYVPRIRFTSDPEKLLVLTQNRHQDRLDIYAANPRSTECKLIVRDQVEPYITEEPYKALQLFDDGFVLMSERSGYNHLYLYDLNGTLVRTMTSGQYVVTDFYGYNPQTGDCFFAANQEGPQYRTICRADSKGKITPLSTQKGTNSAVFSRNFKYYMNTYSSVSTPPVITLNDARGKVLQTLRDNAELKTKVERSNLPQPEFFTFQTSEGVQLNGYMVKPVDFNPQRRYPVIMYQYSGPGSQQVLDQWNVGNMGGAMMERYLAEQGYLCVCVDGRGTGGRGAQFEKQTYQHLGVLEAKDQVETALYLGSLPYVDKEHIGIWGWSYGGFCTLMSMTEGRGVFAAGVAVAPVTNYRFYDSVYTERFMRTPQENPSGYDENPMTRASKLHGALLLCHGSADDNVHLRNTSEFTEALVQADQPFMQLVYTNRNHSIYGGNTRLHLYRSIIQWFNDHLK
ncbi:MAG: DPP IV N-terminal domain-containing protein [Bacteroidaceae bacterium]|nr:DPP IV N-terminal domain-containing protein [Bacteroidaceae bacterium]